SDLFHRRKVYVTSVETPGEPQTITVEVNGKRFGVRLFGDLPSGGGQQQQQPTAKSKSPRRAAGSRASQMDSKVDGVTSPIQGRVAAVRATAGQEVTAGQVLFIVEAMKMENEITAPHAGTLAEVLVQEGITVETGAVMATYKH
ncbi:MAG: biotin/lipoyl-binding protein, partial [Oscillochloris sp.]|nr:biotin/lipoyl-binding protein [Oscillochloris sp.]